MSVHDATQSAEAAGIAGSRGPRADAGSAAAEDEAAVEVKVAARRG